LTHLDDRVHWGESVLTEVVPWGCIAVAVVLHSWKPLLAIPLAFVMWTLGVGCLARLVPTDMAHVRAEPRSGFRAMLILAMLACASYLVIGNH